MDYTITVHHTDETKAVVKTGTVKARLVTNGTDRLCRDLIKRKNVNSVVVASGAHWQSYSKNGAVLEGYASGKEV